MGRVSVGRFSADPREADDAITINFVRTDEERKEPLRHFPPYLVLRLDEARSLADQIASAVEVA